MEARHLEPDLHGIDCRELEAGRVLEEGLQHRLQVDNQLLLLLGGVGPLTPGGPLRHIAEEVVHQRQNEGRVGLVGQGHGVQQPGHEGLRRGLRLQLAPDLRPDVEQRQQEGQLPLLQHAAQLLLSPGDKGNIITTTTMIPLQGCGFGSGRIRTFL